MVTQQETEDARRRRMAAVLGMAPEPDPAAVAVPAAAVAPALPYSVRDLVLYHQGDPDRMGSLALTMAKPGDHHPGVDEIANVPMLLAEGTGQHSLGYKDNVTDWRSPVGKLHYRTTLERPAYTGPFASGALFYLDFPGAKVTSLPAWEGRAQPEYDPERGWRTPVIGELNPWVEEQIEKAMQSADPPDVLAFTDKEGAVKKYALLPHAQDKAKVVRVLEKSLRRDNQLPDDQMPVGVDLVGPEYQPSPEFCAIMLAEAKRDTMYWGGQLAALQEKLAAERASLKVHAKGSPDYKSARSTLSAWSGQERELKKRLHQAQAEQDLWEVRCKEGGDPMGMLRLLQTRHYPVQEDARWEAERMAVHAQNVPITAVTPEQLDWRYNAVAQEYQRSRHLRAEMERLEGLLSGLPARSLAPGEDPLEWKPGRTDNRLVAVRADTGEAVAVVRDESRNPRWKKNEAFFLYSPTEDRLLLQGSQTAVMTRAHELATGGGLLGGVDLKKPPAPPEILLADMAAKTGVKGKELTRQMNERGLTFAPVEHFPGDNKAWTVVDRNTGQNLALLLYRGGFDNYGYWRLTEHDPHASGAREISGSEELPQIMEDLYDYQVAQRQVWDEAGSPPAVTAVERAEFRGVGDPTRRAALENQLAEAQRLQTWKQLGAWADEHLEHAKAEGNYRGSQVYEWAKENEMVGMNKPLLDTMPTGKALVAAIQADLAAPVTAMPGAAVPEFKPASLTLPGPATSADITPEARAEVAQTLKGMEYNPGLLMNPYLMWERTMEHYQEDLERLERFGAPDRKRIREAQILLAAIREMEPERTPLRHGLAWSDEFFDITHPPAPEMQAWVVGKFKKQEGDLQRLLAAVEEEIRALRQEESDPEDDQFLARESVTRRMVALQWLRTDLQAKADAAAKAQPAVPEPSESEELAARVAEELKGLPSGGWLSPSVIADIADDLGVSEDEVQAAVAAVMPLTPEPVVSPRPVEVLAVEPERTEPPPLFDLGDLPTASPPPVVGGPARPVSKGQQRMDFGPGLKVGPTKVSASVKRARTGSRKWNPSGKRR